MGSPPPRVSSQSDMFAHVEGVFYRAVEPSYTRYALAGSRVPGRYSAAGQPTLYLSSSIEGVDAAMIAHVDERSAELDTIEFEVSADRIFDMRDPEARRVADIELADAVAPWKEIVSLGGRPPSWDVRQRVENLGAFGLIDPSRKAPGLWHLVLFAWNTANAPCVRVIDDR